MATLVVDKQEMRNAKCETNPKLEIRNKFKSKTLKLIKRAALTMLDVRYSPI